MERAARDMTCYLSDESRRRLELRAQWSFVSEPSRDGFFRLFNKNALCTTFVRPVSQCPDKMVWIVEVDEPIDPHFKNTLVPV